MGAKGAALMLPFANTAAMQMHPDEISCNVAAKAHGVVLMDRAGWHSTDQLKVPKNLTIILLPSRLGGHFRGGREISKTGTKELPVGPKSISGFTIIKAESLDDAETIARSNPYISSIRVYELMSK